MFDEYLKEPSSWSTNLLCSCSRYWFPAGNNLLLPIDTSDIFCNAFLWTLIILKEIVQNFDFSKLQDFLIYFKINNCPWPMELLADPLKDRVVKNLKAPPHKPLDKALIWPEKMKGMPFALFVLLFWKTTAKNHF